MRIELLLTALALVAVVLAVPAVLAGPGAAGLIPLLVATTYALAVVVAVLRIGGRGQSAALRESLRSAGYRPTYDLLLRGVLRRARRWVGADEPSDTTAPVSVLMRQALTFRLLDRALLLAVIYPLFSLLIFWGTTGLDAVLGQTIIIAAADPWWTGPLALAVILLIAGGPHYIALGERHLRGALAGMAGYLDLIAFAIGGSVLILMDFPWFTTSAILAVGFAALWAFSGFLAGVPAMAVATVLALTGPLAFALHGLLPGAAAFFGAALIALVAALIHLIAVDVFRSRNSPDIAGALAFGIPVITMAAALLLVPLGETGDWSGAIRISILILIVAPVVNVIFDVISFTVTLAFTERGRHGQTLLWAFADIAVAVFLFLALGSTLVCATAALEWLSGTPFVNLERLLDSTWNTSRYWWLYLMMFSTLLPSVVHVSIAALSLQSLAPASWREALCTRIDAARNGNISARLSAPLTLAALWTGCLALVFGAIAGILMILWNLGLAWGVVWYRQWLDMLVVWGGGS
ncbi:hypothetical protein [uncultured Roseobacter sp.]|uniref:hypothetical protein n=1 Tax=uncultured Roseobacter sp. TaxID=114847 RepID=UPI00263092A7|nr:hypothetical protein [uncultured Roseobacter sp.]